MSRKCAKVVQLQSWNTADRLSTMTVYARLRANEAGEGGAWMSQPPDMPLGSELHAHIASGSSSAGYSTCLSLARSAVRGCGQPEAWKSGG
eukprot:1100566-Prymnesium_polylepis.1